MHVQTTSRVSVSLMSFFSLDGGIIFVKRSHSYVRSYASYVRFLTSNFHSLNICSSLTVGYISSGPIRMLEDLYFLRILFALMSFDAQICTCICICNIFMRTPKLKFRPGGSQGGMVTSLIKLYK